MEGNFKDLGGEKLQGLGVREREVLGGRENILEACGLSKAEGSSMVRSRS